ncbi:hypothetical protein LBMAG48_17380 [Phycisphaerae bacterium]|nr:hypothetical protein LBMAG48_17380 [Phycisphaerae bacterium]
MFLRLLARAFSPTRALPRADRREFVADASRASHRLVAVVAIGLVACLLGVLVFYFLAVRTHRRIWDTYDGIADIFSDLTGDDLHEYYPAMLTGLAVFAFGFVASIIWLACLRYRQALARRAECPRCRHGLTGLHVDEAGLVRCPECTTTKHAIAAWNEISTTNGKSEFAPSQRLTSPIITKQRVKRLAIATAVVAFAAGTWWGVREVTLRKQAAIAKADAISLREQHRKLLGAIAADAIPETNIWTAVNRIAAAREQSRQAALAAAQAKYPEAQTLSIYESAIWELEPSDPANQPSPDDLLTKQASIEWFQQARKEPWFAELDTLATLDTTPIWFRELDVGDVPISVLSTVRHLSRLNIARIRTASLADAAQLPLSLRSNFSLAGGFDRYSLSITRLVENAVRLSTAEAVVASLMQPWPDSTLAQMQSVYEASPPHPFAPVIVSEGLWMKASVAVHFSDAARVKRGVHEVLDEGDGDLALVRSLWNDPTDHAAVQRLGSYTENMQAVDVMTQELEIQNSLTRAQRLASKQPLPLNENELVLIAPLRPSLSMIIEQTDAAAALHTLTITALALERHHRAHGTYSDDLAALVPTFLASIPIDPIDNAPLRYRADSARATYTLWSIGPNAIDDGGVTAANYTPRSAASVPNHDIVVHSPKR